MAPELLAGKPASIKSDIYALGLDPVRGLHRQAGVRGKTIAELRQLHDTPHDDDAVGDRARSGPGHRARDPALPREGSGQAAGVGADRRRRAARAATRWRPRWRPAKRRRRNCSLRPARARRCRCGARWRWRWRAPCSCCSGRWDQLRAARSPTWRSMPVARDALADRAEQILRRLGYTEPVGDRAWLQHQSRLSAWAERNGRQRLVERGPQRAAVAHHVLVPHQSDGTVARQHVQRPRRGRRSAGDRRGHAADHARRRGRVIEFRSVPAETVPAGQAATPAPATPPWGTVFEASGLDQRTFTAATPQWVPRDFSDATAAWEGPMPGRPTQRVRVEAAAFRDASPGSGSSGRGRAAATQVSQDRRPEGGRRPEHLLWVSLLLGGVALARRNLRQRRADSRGAARFGIFMFLATLAQRLSVGTHSTDPGDEFGPDRRGADAGVIHRGCLLGVLPGRRAVRPPLLARRAAGMDPAVVGPPARPARRPRAADRHGVRRPVARRRRSAQAARPCSSDGRCRSSRSATRCGS